MAKKKDKPIIEYVLKIGYNPDDEEIEYIDLIDGITIGET